MISEKEKKIVSAVFASRGELKGSVAGLFVLMVAKGFKNGPRLCDDFAKGDITTGEYSVSNDIFEFICTIEEYNQCIEDMAWAEWMRESTITYSRHKALCKMNGADISNKELLKERCDYSFYDKPTTKLNRACDSMEEFKAAVLVYTQDMHNKDIPPLIGSKVVYDLNKIAISMNDEKKAWIGCELSVVANVGFSGGLSVLVSDDFSFSDVVNNAHFKPIKTPEQIKQDKLKDYFKMPGDLLESENKDASFEYRDDVEYLYNAGYIVEPK